RIRDTDSGGLFLEQNFSLRVVAVLQGVVINEIHYNGAVNNIREEFIELHNATGSAVDLSFWRISGGVDFFIPQGTTIPAGGFLIIAQDPPTILSRYGRTALGPWSGALNSDGEEIRLRDANDTVMGEVDFRSEFPW